MTVPEQPTESLALLPKSMTLSITISEPAWKYVCDKANAAALAALPDQYRESFVPVTLETYVQNRSDDLSQNYAEQAIDSSVKEKMAALREQARAEIMGK